MDSHKSHRFRRLGLVSGPPLFPRPVPLLVSTHGTDRQKDRHARYATRNGSHVYEGPIK